MNKLISILLGFLLLSVTVMAQITPKDTLPFENENLKLELVTLSLPSYIHDIFFIDSLSGISVTGRGKIYKTINGGINWSLLYSDTLSHQPLYQIHFTDSKVGYIVGGSTSCGGTGCVPPGGIILKTTDSGNTWKPIFHQSGIEFVSITSTSSGDLFCLGNGTNGEIFKSTDAGYTWQMVERVNFHLLKITSNNNYLFCAGANGKIMRSSDKGTLWASMATLPVYYIQRIDFHNEIGYCIGNNQTVYKTTDNGLHWYEKHKTLNGAFVLHVLTEKNCIVFGQGRYSGGDFGTYDGAIVQSTNGGDDWTFTELTNIEGIQSSSFYTPTKGYVVARTTLIKVTVK